MQEQTHKPATFARICIVAEMSRDNANFASETAAKEFLEDVVLSTK
jgi:hypothetical protein